MFRRKFIRLGSAVLMILALTLPVATITAPIAFGQVATPTGGTGGGRTVTITGPGGFQSGLAVDQVDEACLGSTAAALNVPGATCTTAVPAGFSWGNPVATSTTTATAVTTAHLSGAFNVSVHYIAGSVGSPCAAPCWADIGGSAAADFTYVSPATTSLTPSSGPTGTVVTLTGTNYESTSDVLFGTTSSPGADVVNATFTTIVSTVPASLAPGVYTVAVVNPVETAPQTVSFTVTAAATATNTATGLPTAVGATTVSGTVVGTAPAGTRFLVPATGTGSVPGAPAGSHRVPSANVVLVNQGTGASFGVKTTGTSCDGGVCPAGLATDGTFSLAGVPPGTYMFSVADNDDDNGHTDCGGLGAASGTVCGHLIFQTVVTISATGVVTPSVATVVLAPKTGPSTLAIGPPAVTGIFGEARDAITGLPVVGASVTATGATAGSAITDASGRFAITATTAPGATTVTIVPLAGACAAGAITNLCTDTIITSVGWNDPSFLVVGATTLTATPVSTVIAGALGVGALQGIIPMVFRDTDTSRTGGVDVEVDAIRIVNAGPFRTLACLDFFGSDSQGRRTSNERRCLDLNPNAVGMFTGTMIPSGIMGYAEVFSVDVDGPCSLPTTVATATPITLTPTPILLPSAFFGCVYGESDLHSVVVYRVADADNATAGTNGMTCEDLLGAASSCGILSQGLVGAATVTPTVLTSLINQTNALAVTYKNYGGTPSKWSSVVNACLTSGVPATQPLVMQIIATGDTRGGPWIETRSADPGGCVTLNMNDLTYLPNGTFVILLTSTGLVGPIVNPNNLALPNAFFGAAVHYTRGAAGWSGGGAMAQVGTAAIGGACITTGANPVFPSCPSSIPVTVTGLAQFGASRLFGPLIYSDYTVGGGAWWSGISVLDTLTSQSGGGSLSFTLTVYDEGGVVRGVVNQRASGDSGVVFWLGAQPNTENRGIWFGGQLLVPLERNFRGAFIIDGGDVSGRSTAVAIVHHTNYARNADISYNANRSESLTGPQLITTRNCTTAPMPLNTQLLASGCLFVGEVRKQANGPTTGVRLFNPTATNVTLDIEYYDSSGFMWTDSRTTFQMPAFTTATLFTGTDNRLPALFDGSIVITENTSGASATTGNPATGVGTIGNIVAIANVVDYGVRNRDGSRAYNIPNSTGFSQ